MNNHCTAPLHIFSDLSLEIEFRMLCQILIVEFYKFSLIKISFAIIYVVDKMYSCTPLNFCHKLLKI